MKRICRQLPTEIAGTGRTLCGFIPYNSSTVIVESGRRFTEVIRPGAFARSLAGTRDVLATFNHNADRLLGRSASGTLRITDGPKGLRYEVDLPDSAVDVKDLLARGDLRGSSFTAWPHRDGERWIRRKGSEDLRELLSLELLEVGPVVMPAY